VNASKAISKRGRKILFASLATTNVFLVKIYPQIVLNVIRTQIEIYPNNASVTKAFMKVILLVCPATPNAKRVLSAKITV
jgi:hypothetical protein